MWIDKPASVKFWDYIFAIDLDKESPGTPKVDNAQGQKKLTVEPECHFFNIADQDREKSLEVAWERHRKLRQDVQGEAADAAKAGAAILNELLNGLDRVKIVHWTYQGQEGYYLLGPQGEYIDDEIAKGIIEQWLPGAK